MAALNLMFAISAVWADDLTFTVDRPVHPAGKPGLVRVKVTNASNTSYSDSCSWSVTNEQGEWIAGSMVTCVLPLHPKQSKTFTWDKKTLSGGKRVFVPAGSYTFKIGPFTKGSSNTLGFSWTVALAPSGKLDKDKMFPVSVGNLWSYRRQGTANATVFPKTEVMTLTSKSFCGWTKAVNLAANDRTVLYGTLDTVYADVEGLSKPLFMFGRRKGFTYSFDVPGDPLEGWFRIAGIRETIVTPAGKFTGCYVIEVEESISGADTSFGKFWFAPGVGLIQYSILPEGGPTVTYSLQYATIRGLDKKMYTIGFPKIHKGEKP